MECQSVAQPFTAESWHIGDTRRRLASGKSRSAMDENSEEVMARWYCMHVNARRFSCVAGVVWLLLAGAAAAQTPHTHQHSFAGAEQWAHYFDDPARDAW